MSSPVLTFGVLGSSEYVVRAEWWNNLSQAPALLVVRERGLMFDAAEIYNNLWDKTFAATLL